MTKGKMIRKIRINMVIRVSFNQAIETTRYLFQVSKDVVRDHYLREFKNYPPPVFNRKEENHSVSP